MPERQSYGLTVLTVSTALLCAVDAGGKPDASYANPAPLPFYTAEVRWYQGRGSDSTDSTLDFIIVGRL